MLDYTNQANLLDIRGVCRSFSKGSGSDHRTYSIRPARTFSKRRV
jgi:hypothetical protein